MKEFIILNEQEDKIVRDVKDFLKEKGKDDEIVLIKNNVDALYDLAKSISKYPSILGKQQLGRISRSVETLVDNLQINDIMDLVLHIPTKAILGKAFSIAKINFFYMLFYLLRDIEDLDKFEPLLFEVISNSIFSIMAEEVFLSIIADKEISLHVRTTAGYLLAKIWEYRVEQGVKEFAPILNNIWISRHKIKPNFGTMLGISEMFKLSEYSGPIWIDFLDRDNLHDDEIFSLQEFLMGLSYEEMEELTDEMDKAGKSSINKSDVNRFFEGRKIYPDYEQFDPRELFKSYRHRHKNATFRKRAKLKGPKKTIEEYIMCFLLSRPSEWTDF